MSIKKAFKELFNIKSKGYTFNDEDREISKRKRKLAAELKTAEQSIKLKELDIAMRELELREAEILEQFDDEEDPIEKVVMQQLADLLPTLFKKKMPVSIDPIKELTEEELNNIISTVPKKYLKLAKKMDSIVIITMIKSKFPEMQEIHINQIINKIKN